MVDYQTKHEPVDDYPYICYAPEADANTDELGGGGGGGGGGEPFIVNMIEDSESESFYYTDKTYSEIETAYLSGKLCYLKVVSGDDYVLFTVTEIEKQGDQYSIRATVGSNIGEFTSLTADDYLSGWI